MSYNRHLSSETEGPQDIKVEQGRRKSFVCLLGQTLEPGRATRGLLVSGGLGWEGGLCLHWARQILE